MASLSFLISALAIISPSDAFFSTGVSGHDSVQRMDPMLAPGSWSQHVHHLFGSVAMSPDANFESLRSDTTCTTVKDPYSNSNQGNADDGSMYWFPALYMQAKDGSGWVRIPVTGHTLYYENRCNPADKVADPFDFPSKDFQMIAGVSPWLREPAPFSPDGADMSGITQWICHQNNVPMTEGPGGGFPKDVTDCNDVSEGFNGRVFFPHCWNGEDFDLASPTSHMSYGTGAAGPEAGPCPTTHPTCLPQITIENVFDLHSMVDKVVPNTFTLAHGDPTGFGFHADFKNGWKPGALDRVLKQGIQTFDAFDTDIDSCELPVKYKEEVDTPGQFLPGCNPVMTQNPAPVYAIAPLGVSTNVCSLASGGSASNVTQAKAVVMGSTSMTGTNTTTTPKPTGTGGMSMQKRGKGSRLWRHVRDHARVLDAGRSYWG